MSKKEAEDWMKKRERELKEKAKTFKNEMTVFFKMLKDNHVDFFRVEFQGGGDDGQIESTVFNKGEYKKSWEISKEIGADKYDWNDTSNEALKAHEKVRLLSELEEDPLGRGHISIHFGDEWKTIKDIINDWCMTYTEMKDIDWYNNDGGSGYFEWNGKEIDIEINTNYTEQDINSFTETVPKEVVNG